MRVLLANKPRSYREAFARVFEEVRPRVEAIAVEPGALDREALRLRPDLVVCDRVTPAVETVACSWIELRVENEVLVASSNAGALPAGTNLGLDDLLSVIDRTEELINGESLGRGNADSVG